MVSPARSYDACMTRMERFFPTSRAWVTGRAHGRVLEVGIGSGLNLPHYPREVDLVGLDPDDEMRSRAAERVAESGMPQVSLVDGDAMALPFEDGSFDTVASTFVLCGVPDDRGALVEMVRVLRPGGSLVLADHIVAAPRVLRWIQRGLEAVTVRTSNEHFTRRPLTHLDSLEVDVLETERLSWGAIEHVHARKRA